METLGVPGTVVVMGTPAEETGGGKYIMANNGAWRDCDVCLMTHAMQDYSTPVLISRASWKFRATFHGKPSHAAYAPWNGQNACDAIVMAYNGLACLRQQIQKTETIQSVILEAGKAPNIIPDYAAGTYSIRAKDAKALEALRKRVVPIFEGAAAATGCTVKLYWSVLSSISMGTWWKEGMKGLVESFSDNPQTGTPSTKTSSPTASSPPTTSKT